MSEEKTHYAHFEDTFSMFCGTPGGFERWARLVRSWKNPSTLKPGKLTDTLMLSQTNAEVLEVINDVDR